MLKGSSITMNFMKIAKITRIATIAIFIKFVAEQNIAKIVVVFNPGHVSLGYLGSLNSTFLVQLCKSEIIDAFNTFLL